MKLKLKFVASIFVLLALNALLTSCRVIGGTLPAAIPRANKQKTFVAGAAKIDITPFPGFPMAAYGPSNRYSRGVWTRLHARATYLEDSAGDAIVFVACDLWSMPGGLADRVAELLHSKYKLYHIAREQLAIAATHTHTSPAAFSTCAAHNAFAGNDIGFSHDLYQWLAERIACAVARAAADARPADLYYGEGAIDELARNRSFRAFLANGADAEEILKESKDAHYGVHPTPFPVEADEKHDPTDAYRAFDPRLRVLKITERNTKNHEATDTIAEVAFAGLHPTAMGSDTEVYNSDIFGVAATERELKLNYQKSRAKDGSAVVSIFNTSEGDVVPNWFEHDRRSAMALGGELAKRIGRAAASAEPREDLNIQFAAEYVNFNDRWKPMTGAPMFGGAEGDGTFLSDAGAAESLTSQKTKPEYHKPKLLTTAPYFRGGEENPCARFLANAALFLLNLPEGAWVGVYKIGNIAFATIPGEATTVFARGLERAIQKESGAKNVIMLGLANEYLSYWVTPKEHDLQQYEGASMVYGPESGEMLRDVLVNLSKKPEAAPRRADALHYGYKVGYLFAFRGSFGLDTFAFPAAATDRLHSSRDALRPILTTETHAVSMPNHPHVAWVDRNPNFSGDPVSGAAITPKVSMEVFDEFHKKFHLYRIENAPEDDDNNQFVTSVIVERGGKARWITHWLRPLDSKESEFAGKIFRFRIEGFLGIYHSKEFKIPEILQEKGDLGLLWDPDEKYETAF